MVFVELIVFISVIGLFIYCHIKCSHKYWDERNAPHLPANSFWGNMENPLTAKYGLKYDLKKAHDEFKRLGYKHGGIYLFKQPVYLCVDPDVCKLILTKDFQNFGGRGPTMDYRTNPLAQHLFNLEGEAWRNMRVKLTPTFTSGKMKQMFDTLLDCGIPMLDRIGELSRQKEPLDIKDIVCCYTTDVIASCAFGLECNSFKDPNSEFRKNGRNAIGPRFAMVAVVFLRFVMPSFLKMLPFKFIPQDIEDFFIDLIKSVTEYRSLNKIQRNDFVQLLLDMQEKAKADGQEPMTVTEIAAQSFVFFIAGFETSSTAMTFCLHELAFNQDVQEKLRHEIRETLQENDGKFTYDGVMGMKYLDGVVNGLHYDEEYYPDPEKFIPERFMDENKRGRPQYSYLPFGEGPRNCIGSRFGLMQTKTGLAMILSKFRVLPEREETYKINFDPKLVIMTKKGKLLLMAESL